MFVLKLIIFYSPSGTGCSQKKDSGNQKVDKEHKQVFHFLMICFFSSKFFFPIMEIKSATFS